jgi:hypothetical protein
MKTLRPRLPLRLTAPAFAGPPFDVDDPGTPERRHYELNLSIQSAQVKGSEMQLLPHFDLGYGYTNNLQFGVWSCHC